MAKYEQPDIVLYSAISYLTVAVSSGLHFHFLMLPTRIRQSENSSHLLHSLSLACLIANSNAFASAWDADPVRSCLYQARRCPSLFIATHAEHDLKSEKAAALLIIIIHPLAKWFWISDPVSSCCGSWLGASSAFLVFECSFNDLSNFFRNSDMLALFPSLLNFSTWNLKHYIHGIFPVE